MATIIASWSLEAGMRLMAALILLIMLLPLLADIGERDPVPLLERAADLLRDDDRLLDSLAAELDPTDARALAAAPLPLARRAVRRWLLLDGLPPGAADVARVLDVATGRARACEVGGGRRVDRSEQRLRLYPDRPRGR